MIDEKRIRKNLVIALASALMIVLLFWICLNYIEERVQEYVIDEEMVSDDVIGNLDYVTEDMSGYIEISGWVIRPQESIQTIEEHVLLRNIYTGETIIIPTEVKERVDIQEKYGNNSGYEYTNCGFYSRVSEDKLELSDNDYEIYVLVNINSNEDIIKLENSLRGIVKDE